MTQPIEIFSPEIEAFGGAERSVLALSRWLHGRGIARRLLTYSDRVGMARHADHALEVVELGSTMGAVARVRALRNHLHGGERQARLLCSGYQPALHATLAGARGFHCLMHDTPALFDEADRTPVHRARRYMSNLLVGVGLRSGGATIVTSEFLKAECHRDFRVTAHIARMGGLPSREGFRERHFTGTLRMLSVCRLEANKRIDWMLDALATLERQQPALSTSADWRLDIVGKGTLMSALQARVRELGLESRISLHGFVADDRLQQLMAGAHLFLMPAVQGYGIPAVEALQAGIPVLLHRESGVSDVLLESLWATVFTGGKAEMVNAMRDAIAGIVQQRTVGQPLPCLATEEEWAERVARLCGWIA